MKAHWECRGLAACSVMPANEANGVGGRSYGRIVLYLQRVSPAEWYIYIYIYIHIYIYIYIHMYLALGLLLRMTQILVLHLQVVLLFLFAVFNRLLRLSLVKREKGEGKSLTTGFDRNLRVCVCVCVWVWVFVLCVWGLGNVQWSGFVRVIWDFNSSSRVAAWSSSQSPSQLCCWLSQC